MTDDVPTVRCPRCGIEQDNQDGFGVLHCANCGYCTHPSSANGVCDLCAERIWEPIDTCPPAPTRVLLWFPALGYPVTGFPEAYAYKTGGWKATHWMPLPAPPSQP